MMFGILALIFLGLYVGFPFWIYWFVRLRLKAMAQATYRGRPVALFLFGLLFVIIASVFLVGGLFLLFITMTTIGVVIASLLGFGLGVSGAIGWVVLLFQRVSDKSSRLAFERKHPLPKLQLWMQDLFAAAFCPADSGETK